MKRDYTGFLLTGEKMPRKFAVLCMAIILFFAGNAHAINIVGKITNPENRSGQPDGIKPGGDRENSYSWCMDVFQHPDGEYLYVGSNRDLMFLFLMASLLSETFPQGITIDYLCNTTFNGDIPIATDLKGRIFRWKTDNSGDWEVVYTSPPLLPNSIYPRDLGYRGALTFSDADGTDTGFYIVSIAFPAEGITTSTRVLKFPYNFVLGDAPKEVLRIASPSGQSNTLRPISKYQDRLYVGTSHNEIYESALPVEQPQAAWPPDTSTIGWNLIATDADFGNAWQNYKYFCWQFQEYSGYLYVILGSVEPDDHTQNGFLMYRGKPDSQSDMANSTGWVWEEIIGNNGLYPSGMGDIYQGVACLAVFNGYLYLGTFNDVLGPLVRQGPMGIVDSIHQPKMFRFNAENNCEMVIGDTKPDSEYAFLRTRVGNYRSGFYNPTIAQMFFPAPYNEFNYSLNQYIWWMEPYHGKLYCATFDIRSLLKYLDEDVLITFGVTDPQRRTDILKLIDFLYQANDNPAGFDIYMSQDGINWNALTLDGFGDQFNYGGRVMKSSDNTMYVGTANPFYGCQVWTVKDVAPSGSSGGGGGCFIATVAFGSPLAKQVGILKQFRDRFLMKNIAGRKFVGWYYKNGPIAASFMMRHPYAKFFVRIMLYPLVLICWLWVSGLIGYFLVLTGICISGIITIRTYRKRKIPCS